MKRATHSNYVVILLTPVVEKIKTRAVGSFEQLAAQAIKISGLGQKGT